MTIKRPKNTGKKLPGFSLAEALLAVAILGIATAGVLVPYTTGAALRAQGHRRTTASRLAGDLMEQILDTPFENVVEQFDSYTEPQGQIKDANGTVFTDPAYDNFSREANCTYVYVPQETGNTQPVFIRAEVTVSYANQRLITINRLICK